MYTSDIKMGSFTGWSYHQAGHLVAAAKRGADPNLQLRIGELLPRDCVEEAGAPFVAYAGPWAERHCGAMDVEIVQGDDAFDPSRISATCGDRDVVDDANTKVAALLHRVVGDQDKAWGWLPGVTAAWHGELAEVWDDIEWAAGVLRDEHVLSVRQVRSRLAGA